MSLPSTSNERASFADAERREDSIEDIVGGGCAGKPVERAQCVVEIKQQHLVGNVCGGGGAALLEGELAVPGGVLVCGRGSADLALCLADGGAWLAWASFQPSWPL